MSATSKIEWTEATWNPLVGCTKVSAGCDHCYAETLVNRFAGKNKGFPNRFDVVTIRDDKMLTQPLRWRQPKRIFVNSLSDLFHDDVPAAFIAKVFAVMALAEQHTFQLLTKRHGRMRSLLDSRRFLNVVDEERELLRPGCGDFQWPLPNVWLGVSVENQQWADIRIPALLNTPAAVRWISAEPLLGPVTFRWAKWQPLGTKPGDVTDHLDGLRSLDWVVVGGESGPGARPMHPDWARSIRDLCVAAGVPFLFKQRGEWTWNEPTQFRIPVKPYSDRVAVMHGAGMTAMTKSNPFNPFAVGHPYWFTRIERVGKKAAGRELDGRTWDEYPAVTA